MIGLFDLSNQLFWMLVVAVGFPLATIFLGEINLRLRRAKHPLFTPLSNLRNLILPTLTLFLLLFKVMGLARDTVGVRISETLLWIAVIYTTLSVVNIILFEDAKEGTWQSNVPKLFLDLSRFFLVLIGTAIVLSSVWQADLGGLLTALGVGSLVIGLALQDSLSNIFSGMALLFERPFKLGDWIQVGDTLGKVVEITWRSVHLQTKSGDIVIVPNSELAGGTLKNYNRPLPTYRIDLELGFSYDDPPNKIKQILTQTALETEGVLSKPPPLVVTSAYADFTINYQVLLYIADCSQELSVRDRFMTRVWYVAKRYNLNIPYPIAAEYEYQSATPTPEMLAEIAKKTLAKIPSLSQFGSEMLDTLSQKGTWLDFARGEFVILENEPLLGLYVIIEGTAQMSLTDKMGQVQIIGQLEQGELFGEKASLISEQISDVSILAVEDLQVLLLDKNTLQTLLEHSPRLSNEIGEIMELRRRAVRSFFNVA
mgnify:CR=1 FL=1